MENLSSLYINSLVPRRSRRRNEPPPPRTPGYEATTSVKCPIHMFTLFQSQPLTIVKFLHISLHFLHTLVNIIKWSESDVSLYLSPRRQLVDRPLRTLDLCWLHSGGCGKLVLVFTGMLKGINRITSMILT